MKVSGHILLLVVLSLISVVSFAQAADSLRLHHIRIESTDFPETFTCDTSCINNPQKEKIAAIHTNLLAPLSNIGVEICINHRWSVEGDYYFPWLPRKADHKNAMQLLAWGITGRRWFGQERTYQNRFLGHSIGLGAYIGYYDLERNYSGHQGEFASVVLDYTYAIPIFKEKMHLEFSLGAGYLYSYTRPYNVFEDGGKAFREGYAKKVNWIGPLKAAVSLVVPISIKTGAKK